MDYPEYIFSEAAPWTCTMGFPGSALQAFGLAYGPFPKKDTAKKTAAMEAVKWLRAEGKLTEIATKRRKSSAVHQPDARPIPDSTQSLMETIDVNDTEAPCGESLAQQVYNLARALGFSQPKFDSVKGEGNFVDESASFAERDVRYEPRLAGIHGQVRHVFGKKLAHNECCRGVLQLLKEIQQLRTV